ncbi:MAG: putative porin [Verrucomicrobiota bacterium]
MTKTLKKMTAVAAGLVIMTLASVAQDSGALVDALVKKGILTDQEAEEIRADLTKEYSQTNAGKLNFSSAVTQLKIYGDARVRYQWENAQTNQTNVGGTTQANVNQDRSRYRYRVRLGAEYTLTDNFKAGVRLETAQASDSTNSDFGRYFSKDPINIGLAYLEYEDTKSAPFGMADNVDVRLGKMLNPFYFSPEFWDSDINPEGLSAKLGWKNVGESGLNLSLGGAGYVTAEANNSTANTDDGFLLVGQVQMDYTFANKSNLMFAPTILTESQGTLALSGAYTGESTSSVAYRSQANENEQLFQGDLTVLMLPVQYTWKGWGFSHKVWATYAYNFAASKRYRDMTAANDNSGLSAANMQNMKKGQDSAFDVGYQLGENKKKGDFSITGYYSYVEAAAYTSNLSDSDFAKNLLNQQGTTLQLTYNLTDAITTTAKWFHSNEIDKGMANVASAGAKDTIDVLQLDVAWKF